MNEENIYQHFHSDERRFVDRCLDWIEQVENSYSVVTTYFLNPREAQILRMLANMRKLQIFSSQNLAQSELSKTILAPDYYRLDEDDFDMILLEIRFAAKFVQISHAQILGTFLGQTGVKRQEIGDIIVNDEVAQIFVSRHLIDFFKSIDKIGRASVKIKIVPLTALLESQENFVKEIVLADSLRIDKIIAISLKISRNIAVNMLESNKVKINYLEIDKKDFSVKEGDLISIRGYGRIKIDRILGVTKKGKQKIEVGIIKNRKK